MALKKDGKRQMLGSTVRKDNKDFLDELNKNTGIPISKLLDLAIDVFRNELNNTNVLELSSKYKDK